MADTNTEMKQLLPGPNIDVLLVGKSGHGKSSTGNSILGRREFKSMGGGRSVTKKYQLGVSKVDGREIKVVDIPGLCDTDSKSEEEKAKLVIEAIAKGLSQFPQGFSALLLVLSYATRITPEEIEAIKVLKLILGKDALKNHAVVVFTFGDSFRNDLGDDANFQTWCQEQDSDTKELLEECRYRCVIFDNITRDKDEKKSQLVELVRQVDSLKDYQARYTMEKFQFAEGTRSGLMPDTKLQLMLEQYSRQNALIKQDLHEIVNGPPDFRMEKIEEMKLRISGLMREIEDNARGNDRLDSVIDELKKLSETVEMFETLIQEQEQGSQNSQPEDTQQITTVSTQIGQQVDNVEHRIDQESENTPYWRWIYEGVHCVVRNCWKGFTAFLMTRSAQIGAAVAVTGVIRDTYNRVMGIEDQDQQERESIERET